MHTAADLEAAMVDIRVGIRGMVDLDQATELSDRDSVGAFSGNQIKPILLSS